MKIITASNGKKSVKMSKSEWKQIGKKAGWIKTAQEDTNIIKIKNSIPKIVKRCNDMIDSRRRLVTPLSNEVAINNLTKSTKLHETGGDPVESYETTIPYEIKETKETKESKSVKIAFNVYSDGHIAYLDPFATQWLPI